MEALKALLESDAISEQMKSEIQEAWDVKNSLRNMSMIKVL
jgi:hypothetical protein